MTETTPRYMPNPEQGRLHGDAPYSIVAVHGGPGAVGEARPIAEALAPDYGVIEPFLLSETLEGQVGDLKAAIETNMDNPAVLVGHSYGALLSYMFAARYPKLVKKLVLISSAVFEEKDAEGIQETRLSRLSNTQQEELLAARDAYKTSVGKAKEDAFVDLFTRVQRADSFDPIPHTSDLTVIRPALYDSVWEGMEAIRDSGDLVAYGKKIHCPVVAIHGDYDPRPAEAVERSLRSNVGDLEFILLKHCGHYPWYENQARNQFPGDTFFDTLRRSVQTD